MFRPTSLPSLTNPSLDPYGSDLEPRQSRVSSGFMPLVKHIHIPPAQVQSSHVMLVILGEVSTARMCKSYICESKNLSQPQSRDISLRFPYSLIFIFSSWLLILVSLCANLISSFQASRRENLSDGSKARDPQLTTVT